MGAGRTRAADWSEEFTGGFANAWIFAADAGNIPPDASAISIHPNSFLEMQTSAAPPDLSAAPPDLSAAPPDLFVAGFVPANLFADVAATASVSAARGQISNNDIFLTVRSDGTSGYLLNLDFNIHKTVLWSIALLRTSRWWNGRSR